MAGLLFYSATHGRVHAKHRAKHSNKSSAASTPTGFPEEEFLWQCFKGMSSLKYRRLVSQTFIPRLRSEAYCYHIHRQNSGPELLSREFRWLERWGKPSDQEQDYKCNLRYLDVTQKHVAAEWGWPGKQGDFTLTAGL